jgi:dienelactone hydrolase
MFSRLTLAFIIQFCALVAWAAMALADPVQFTSAPVPPTPLMQHRAGLRGTVALPRPGDPIAGELYKPVGDGPFPAIVALHGCEGWLHTPERRQRQAERYVAQGYAILLVNSFAPRGIKQACVPPPGSPPMDRLGDAYGALDWLATRPFVDASRIALLGASQGERGAVRS